MLKLISFNICPFVQRSVITLWEKGVPHELEYIDLSDKPSWFLELSPSGRVPVLLVGETVLFESAAINEYLDETTGEPRLQPQDPLIRAKNRAWIEFASALTVSVHKLMVATDETSVHEQRDSIRSKADKLEETIVGPFFNGEAFALVDAAFAPALQRATWCEALVPALELFDRAPKVARWRDALLARPSVIKATPQLLTEGFSRYLAGDRGAKKRNEQPSKLLAMRPTQASSGG